MIATGRDDNWRVSALLAGLTVCFYWKIIFTNQGMFPWDAAEFFYPHFNFVHEELRHFRLPLWDPYVMSGYPIVGDPEAQIFYPFNWLFVLFRPFAQLPYKFAELQVILHFFLAGLFMYYLARSFVKSTAAALCAAILYQYGGTMVAHTQHLASIESMAWFPLIFLLARRGLLERNLRFTVWAGVAFGLQVLTGHFQHSVYLGILLFFYFAYEACFGPSRRLLWPRWIYSLLIIAAIGAGLAMVQIVPTYEFGKLSVRSYLIADDITIGNEPRFLWTLFLPNYFGSLNGVPQWYQFDLSFNYVFYTVPGCLLALLGIFETLRRRNFFWLAMTLLCVELSLGSNGFLGKIVYHIPLVNMFRNIPMFLDIAHVAICVLAAIGAESLFSDALAPALKKSLPAILTVLLLSATALGVGLRLSARVHDWYHMLALLALCSTVLAAFLGGKMDRAAVQWSILGLIGFQLLFYHMNQGFNWTPADPRKYISRNYALGFPDGIAFYRADRSGNFRVAAIAESPWSANGWHAWRIPSIYGWNPMTLRRYDEYIRGFTESAKYTLPYGGPDDNFQSSMLDLLGAKYVMVADSDLEKSLGLQQSKKFRLAFADQGFWKTYENKDYLSRVWFYPRADVLPDGDAALALMSSNWFDGRKTLVVEENDLKQALQNGAPEHAASQTEAQSIITLNPGGAAAFSSGVAMTDPYCADALPMFAGWAEKKDEWIRYEFPGPTEAGRYLVLLKYTAARQPTPLVAVQLQNGEREQRSEPVRLPGTSEWRCDRSRWTELGTLQLAPGQNRLTITSAIPSDIHIYSLQLVRLPSGDSADAAGSFAFSDFAVSANRIAFRSRQDQDGFVLLNEVNYPGWEATVDGTPTPILPADHIFRTLFIPAGSHRIEYRFRPRHFALAAAISFLTLSAFLLYITRSTAGSKGARDSSETN